MTDYRALRQAFTPDTLELIIVAESPPEGGTYFYDDRNRGVLFREMMKLIGENPRSKIEGLRAFQVKGWLLVDATYEPVNKYDEAKRNAAILRDYPKLVADLTNLMSQRAVPIILIKKNVHDLLEMKLKAEGFRVLNEGIAPPFPTYRPDEFRTKFNKIINGQFDMRCRRELQAGSNERDFDWVGNNAAFTCPVCRQIFLVSARLHTDGRDCPNCGKSNGRVVGGKNQGGSAVLRWAKMGEGDPR
jgi:hypothetical protein